MGRTRALVVVVAGLALAAGCGSGGADTPPDTPAASASPSTSRPPASASPTSSPSVARTGTLVTKRIECTGFTLGKGMKRANVGPPTWCAFESETDYVAFGVGTYYPRNIDQAATLAKANSNGQDVIEPVSADGWTFAARWPDDGKFVRVQWWLADSKNAVLECKMGSDRGMAGITELGAICDQAKAKLHTP